MPLTPDQIDALPIYSAAQHLKMWKRADIEIAERGVSYAISGRELRRNDATHVQAQIIYWEQQAAIEADPSSANGIALVKFGETT